MRFRNRDCTPLEFIVIAPRGYPAMTVRSYLSIRARVISRGALAESPSGGSVFARSHLNRDP